MCWSSVAEVARVDIPTEAAARVAY